MRRLFGVALTLGLLVLIAELAAKIWPESPAVRGQAPVVAEVAKAAPPAPASKPSPSVVPEMTPAEQARLRRIMQEKLAESLLQRRRGYPAEVENRMLAAGFDLHASVSGAKATILTLRYVLMNRPAVFQIVNQTALPAQWKEMGFVTVVLTDGHGSTWRWDAQKGQFR